MSNEVVELCRQMVKIPSINPQDSGWTEEPYGEKRMADFVYGWLEEQGLNPRRQNIFPQRDNVYAFAPGEDRTRTMLFTGHMDTVEALGMIVEPFAAEVRAGKIYGRGSSDDKGPLSAMMIAFRDRVRAGSLPGNLVFLATCAEEHDMSGSKYFAAHHDQIEGKLAGGVFAEPTGLKVVAAHRGIVRLQLNTHGKPAHSSVPDKGKNAIYTMAHAITLIEPFADQLAQRPPHPQLGHETIALTIVQGGKQINVVPESCQGFVDWRILPGRNDQICRNELNEFLNEKLGDQISIDILHQHHPMETDPQSPIVTALFNAAQKTIPDSTIDVCQFATDAGSFSQLNIPTPVFGPGDEKQAHTADESIEIEQLEKGLEIYSAFLASDWGI
ncbi:MAG: M20 family metallopeptidase [Planctomycetes bacterium]|nr:M20 family metallopeptidase [Planctomycetota bacterium]